jgi:tetratricopeptide (TPR) repeat protein
MELGDIYLTESLPDLAAGAYVRAIDVDSEQSMTRPIRAAEILASRGSMPQAKTVSSHIREVSSGNGRLDDASQRRLLKLDARIAMSDGADDAGTVTVLEEIIKLDPLDGEALMLLGQHYTRQGEYDRAIFYYERAESIESMEATARVRHAQVLVSMKRYSDALPLLRRAQEIKPRDDVARYAEQVDRLSKSQK